MASSSGLAFNALQIAGNGFENSFEEAAKKAQLFLLRLKPVAQITNLARKAFTFKFISRFQKYSPSKRVCEQIQGFDAVS